MSPKRDDYPCDSYGGDGLSLEINDKKRVFRFVLCSTYTIFAG